MSESTAGVRPALLVLGASRYQMPVIAHAKALGYRVITTDNVPSNPGHALSDASYNVDTTDTPSIVALARRENINGVISPCTDVAVASAAQVASTLGLPGPPPLAASTLSDKIRFRAWLEGTGLPAPKSFIIDPQCPIWPGHGSWVLKPARSSGSKGIFIVESESELRARLPETLAFGTDVLLEAFIAGEQLTCEGFLRDGVPVAAWVTKRETAPAPYVATWGHRLPSGQQNEVERAVIDAVTAAFHLLGVHNGPFDADVVWDGTRCHLLEATPRLGGNSLSRLVLNATGFDLVHEAIEFACGKPFAVHAPKPPTPSAIVLLGVMTRGRLAYDEAAVSALRAEPWVVGLELDVRNGAQVEPFIHGRHRLGEALIKAEDDAGLRARYAEVRTRLSLSVGK